MVDLATTWLGLPLRSPVVVSASPLSKDPEAVATAVEKGAGAVVMYSLFEEQLVARQLAAHRYIDALADLDAETQTARPAGAAFSLGVEPYLRDLRALKKRVDVPVVASLNGTSPGGWTDHAARLQDAGADAIELNLYEFTTSPDEDSAAVEKRLLDVVRGVVGAVRVPVNVKLGFFHAALPAFVKAIEKAGARGVTVFNRFYQPDISLETLDVDRRLFPSTSAELPLRLNALAVLSPNTSLSLACTGGVHTGLDAAKALLAGAHVVQVATALLEHGPAYTGTMLRTLSTWLTEQGYTSVDEARGVLNLHSAPDPHAWERHNYMKMLQGWTPRTGWRRGS